MEFLLHALNHDSQEVQAIAAVGIAKLMLSGMLPDAEVSPLHLRYNVGQCLTNHRLIRS